jgi:hypothetical protein
MNAITTPSLLAIALRELVDAPVDGHVEALDELLAQRRIHTTARSGEPVQELAAGHPRVELELAGEIAAARMDRDTVAAAVEAEHPSASRARVTEVQQRPDRGRLPGTIGAKEPEHLPRLDTQVQMVDRDRLPEHLRQPIGFDRGAHHGLRARCWPRTGTQAQLDRCRETRCIAETVQTLGLHRNRRQRSPSRCRTQPAAPLKPENTSPPRVKTKLPSILPASDSSWWLSGELA